MKTINDKQRDFMPKSYSGFGNTYRVASINAQRSTAIPAPPENHAIISLVAKPHVYDGYMKNYRQPVGAIYLQVKSINALQMNQLQQAADYYFSISSSNFPTLSTDNALVSYFGAGLCTLQKMAGLPIFDAIQLSPRNDNTICLWVPTLISDCLHQAIAFMLTMMNHHGSPAPFVSDAILANQMQTLVNTLRRYAPKGRNSLKLLQAAHDEQIPWHHVAQNTYQYGYGSNSCWFDSSFTEKTSQISAAIARDKLSTSRVLHQAGIPVPEQYALYNENDAISIVNKMGYPVVIKPHNQDGGKGVFAKLISEIGVRKAYKQARMFSDIVLLEKHITGKDYRLVVFNGQLVWAVERTPASITGDGENTISKLIEQVNQQPERGVETHSPLKRIKVTEDVIDFLAEQGLNLESIPNHGQFVPLNRVANVSTGGTPVGVLNKVHPDNKRLVEAAVNLLRLDIAGVDFISPNIEQSYLENGGAIIEINAQPQMGLTPQHVYSHILSTLLPNQGRIPILVICSDIPQHNLLQSLQQDLRGQYQTIGLATEKGAYINDQLFLPTSSLFLAGKLLLSNRTVNALIYFIQKWEDIEHQGLPFDTYDTLYSFHELTLSETHSTYNNDKQFVMDTLLNACQGQRISLKT